MKFSYLAIGFIAVVLLVSVSAVSGVEPSTISPQLKIPNSSQPFDDKAFQERADFAIKNLTNPFPTENNLMELQSAYYDLVKKNVKQDFYAEARNITKFLFYDMKAAEEMQDYKGQTGPNHIQMDFREDIGDQAYADLDAAKQAWKSISHRYPNFTPAFP